MAVPTSYTYDTFADYLKDEVLRDSAAALGFEDYVPEIPEIVARVIVRTNSNTTSVPIYQPGFTLASGTSLAFSNGATRTLGADMAANATSITISSAANLHVNDFASIQLRAAVARIRNSIYDSITDETLISMGLTDIAQVVPANIEIFRAYGRLELLRKVMQNVAAKYNYTMPVGGPMGVNNLYTQVGKMFQKEQERLATLLTIEQPPTAMIPEEVQSAFLDTEVKF